MSDTRSDQSAFPTKQAGFWAAAAPLLCAVHCIATPLLVLFLPALALNHTAEYTLMLLSAGLAVGFLVWGVRLHDQWLVWLPVVAGLLLWGGGHALFGHSLTGQLANALGGIMLAGGLVWNAWLRHEALCRGCGCPAHEKKRGCCDSTTGSCAHGRS